MIGSFITGADMTIEERISSLKDTLKIKLIPGSTPPDAEVIQT